MLPGQLCEKIRKKVKVRNVKRTRVKRRSDKMIGWFLRKYAFFAPPTFIPNRLTEIPIFLLSSFSINYSVIVHFSIFAFFFP